MKTQKIQIGNKKVMPFTIPSGIVTTSVSCLEKLANEIPEIGILTTKSIGPVARTGNREPILAQYLPGCFINAVGLTNPGAKEFANQLSNINFPKDKFLLASIFGKNEEEFVYVAKILKDNVDGFELNLSCPHAKGYGMQLGQDSEIVGKITKAIVGRTHKPVFAKLTPNAGNIAEIAQSAMSAGAYGIVAINTVGPGYHSVHGKPVLTNKVGGMSGIGITPISVRCVKDITDKLGNIPIIGMGGISTARDVEAYASVGASMFGIGSVLAGMDENKMKNYFATLINDLNSGTDWASEILQDVDMTYKKVGIVEKVDVGCDFKLFKTNRSINAGPGQFVFAWIPGVGEKPFSIMDNDPLTLGILERGEFTKKINSLENRDEFYIRGPYGKGVKIPNIVSVSLVAGGCGIAGIYLLAKKLNNTNNVNIFLGAKDKEHVAYLKEFERFEKVHVATEDGSLGERGLVTDLINEIDLRNNYFYNCGPRAMIDAILPAELLSSPPERIYSSVDYMTRCGVGICGSCADEKGRRTCVEGPFMNP